MIAVNLNRRVLSLESGASEMRELVRAFYGTLENAAACGVRRGLGDGCGRANWIFPVDGSVGSASISRPEHLRPIVDSGGSFCFWGEPASLSKKRVYCHYLPNSSVSGGAAIS